VTSFADPGTSERKRDYIHASLGVRRYALASVRVEAKLEELGLVLPGPMQAPAGVRLPFAFARVHGNRVYIAGHGPQAADGAFALPLGKVGAAVSPEQGY
jgi:hypothetical protein